LVRALLDCGRANINICDVNNATPLFWSSRAPEISKLLVQRGADIWLRNSRGSLAWEADTQEGDDELPASDKDRARLKAAVNPPAGGEEPRRGSRAGGAGPSRGDPGLAMLEGTFGSAWLANKMRGASDDDE
jgi:hypothetical protein